MQSVRAVQTQDLNGPIDLIFHPLPVRLRSRPKLEIFKPIVMADTVHMVNAFMP